MKKILLTKRKFAIVDNADFWFLNQWKWYFTNGYARRDVSRVRIYMHRFILKIPKEKVCDHINRNKLDNRKSNLRIVTQSQNMMNSKKPITNTSGYKGVTWFLRDGVWKAQIKLNQKNFHLGYFKNIKDAISTRKKAEKMYHQI
jgi:HNH endonuclease